MMSRHIRYCMVRTLSREERVDDEVWVARNEGDEKALVIDGAKTAAMRSGKIF